jgi:hypothetical protein
VWRAPGIPSLGKRQSDGDAFSEQIVTSSPGEESTRALQTSGFAALSRMTETARNPDRLD